MKRRTILAVVVAALVSLSGWGAALGGGGSAIGIGEGTANGNLHVYVQSTDGPLPAETKVTRRIRITNGRWTETIQEASTRLESNVSEKTKVYIAGAGAVDGLALSIGERADGGLPQPRRTRWGRSGWPSRSSPATGATRGKSSSSPRPRRSAPAPR